MYLEYFGLREYSFQLTPDVDFLYLSPGHARAKSYMDYTIWNRDGFLVITGEVGSGKTTLIQKLLSELDENVLVAKIFQTQLDEVEFLQAVLVEFGLNPFNAKKVELLDMLNTFLIGSFSQLKQLVLLVDDAHNLSPKVLEEIRMLSGLETRKEKMLHIILVGQPELKDVIESPGMEQLLQRIRLRCHLKGLTEQETKDYVMHRLRIAGCAEPSMLFAKDTFPIIFKYTGGIPRLINTLCDTALICAYADNLTTVSAEVIKLACGELQWSPYTERNSSPRAPRAGRSELQATALLQDHSRLLSAIEGKMNGLDALVPTLNQLSKQMGNMETVLKALAEALGRKEDNAQGTRLRAGK